MSASSLFEEFRKNLSVRNSADISTKYCNITARLNRDFWQIESDTAHSLQIGSYGRRTAIAGVSDLDMVFEIPEEDYDRYRRLDGNGPSTMLQEVRQSLLNRYPKSDVSADGQIVAVNFTGYRVEVLPAFLDDAGDYIHGDTNDGGSWKLTKPRPEIAAVSKLDATAKGNLKDVCKMLRSWKNKVGVGIGGLLIDTLAHDFFVEHEEYHNATYSDYPALLIALFTYIGDLPEQAYWLAPGSNQRVRCKAPFQAKAKKAAARCREAAECDEEEDKAALWRKVFGSQFPKAEAVKKTEARDIFDKEQFIEDRYPIDIRYNIELDCEIREANVLRDLLRRQLRRKERVPIGRHLRFYVSSCDVPKEYAILWKVRNRGAEAKSRRMLRGEITFDQDGGHERLEKTDFPGDHYVEAYAVKDGVCVARERIIVPI